MFLNKNAQKLYHSNIYSLLGCFLTDYKMHYAIQAQNNKSADQSVKMHKAGFLMIQLICYKGKHPEKYLRLVTLKQSSIPSLEGNGFLETNILQQTLCKSKERFARYGFVYITQWLSIVAAIL